MYPLNKNSFKLALYDDFAFFLNTKTLVDKTVVQSTSREHPSMIRFTLKKNSRMIRDKLYSISIDVENFPNLLPKYFKSIIIKKSTDNEIFVDEKIHFLGSFLVVKTKHVIVHPRTHEIHILSGLMRGSSFVESYDEISNGTNVTIDVSIKLNGVSKLLLPFEFLIKRQMARVMDEFLDCAEKFVLDSSDSKN